MTELLGRAHTRRGIRSERNREIGGLTVPITERIPAAKLSRWMGRFQSLWEPRLQCSAMTVQRRSRVRYEELAEEISRQIAANLLRPGNPLPSIRQTCRTRHLKVRSSASYYSLLQLPRRHRRFVRQGQREGALRERIRYFCRFALNWASEGCRNSAVAHSSTPRHERIDQ
jgi:hypothetical protein